MIMKTILNHFIVLLVMGIGIFLYSCDEEEPIIPPQPVPSVQFSTENLSLTFGSSTSVTLVNFTGVLIQEGKVEGFKVAISGNVVTITPEQYNPGSYTFTFKGEGKFYSLKVTLKKIDDIPDICGVFTEKNEILFDPKYTVKRFKSEKISSFLISANQDNPKEQYVLISDLNISGKEVSFTLKAHGIQKMSDGVRYLPDGEQRGLKGSVISEAGAAKLRIYAKLSNSKGINILIPNS